MTALVSCRRQRRFLLDALPLVGTAESLETMIALWKSEQITGAELDSWLAAIPFQTRAKPKMLSALLVSDQHTQLFQYFCLCFTLNQK